jgi:hypothetical protein
VVLLAYDPFTRDSPYRQPGPILVHERACAPAEATPAVLPDQLTRRLLSVRTFDADALMVQGLVTPGVELARAAADLLADGRVDHLHVHNAGPGCFAVRIDRA